MGRYAEGSGRPWRNSSEVAGAGLSPRFELLWPECSWRGLASRWRRLPATWASQQRRSRRSCEEQTAKNQESISRSISPAIPGKDSASTNPAPAPIPAAGRTLSNPKVAPEGISYCCSQQEGSNEAAHKLGPAQDEYRVVGRGPLRLASFGGEGSDEISLAMSTGDVVEGDHIIRVAPSPD